MRPYSPFILPKGSVSKLIFLLLVVVFLTLESCVPEPEAPAAPTPTPTPAPIPVPPPALPSNPCGGSITSGYTDRISYFAGEEIKVYLNSQFRMLCRLDIYNIDGTLAFSVAADAITQTLNANEPSQNGFGYTQPTQFTIPALESGIYLIENQIPFIIKTNEPVDVLVVYPSNTANAYSESGGKSLYSKFNRPYEVSFLRPIPLQSLSSICLKWFNTLNDFSFGYISDADLDDYSSIGNAKLLCLVGHNEYWTRAARLNFDKFVNSGGDALILSGNTMWWQVRYSDDKQRLICYKDGSMDPISDPLLKTITWDSPSLDYQIIKSIGVDFNRGGYGLQPDLGWDGYKIVREKSPLFEGLNLRNGNILSLPTLEYDGAPISSFDAEGNPVLDLQRLGYYKGEIIAFDKGFRVKETFGTFCVFQPSVNSGIIVNTASTDWCSTNGLGGLSGADLKKITLNSITKLLNNQSVFSE
jgi:hypothetical protein